MPTKKTFTFSRRAFLTLSGVGVLGAAGLYLGFQAGRRYIWDNLGSFRPPVEAEPNSWLIITPEGRVHLLMPKAEMGQGVHTAFQQIVAEELEVALEQVEVVLGDTSILPVDNNGTNGSNSIASLYPVLRQVAAQAREMLKAEAAKKLNVATQALTVAAGVIVAEGVPTEWSYGKLIGGQKIVALADDQPVPLKSIEAYTVIGQPALRDDIRLKVTGEARYGYDARVEGMKFGKVLKPPTLGAKLKGVNAASIENEPGVLRVVVEGNFVGVVAETQEVANRAINLLAAQWEERRPAWQQSDLDAMLPPGGWGGEGLRSNGDVEAALRSATQSLTADYVTPMATHASLEAPAALAYVRQENGQWRAEVWTATQGPTGLLGQLARGLGLEETQIIVHPLYLGGGFGRKTFPEPALEAARLSKATGMPVRVNWDRTEEFQNGFARPPHYSRLRAGLTAEGRIAAWDHQHASGLVLFSVFPAALRMMFLTDFGAIRGAVPLHYAFGADRTTSWLRDELPVPTGSWRGLGLLPSVFAVESFVDELAHAASQDPLAFRLTHVTETSLGQRMRRALEQVAQLAHWDQPLAPAAKGWVRGHGLACCEDVQTVVAQVAEVAVHSQTGEIKVERVYCAVDCGLVINPDIVRAQVDGNVMWGVGSALIEELTVKDGRLSATNFSDYPLLTIRQAPEVVTTIIENRTEGPYGMGEPPIGPVAAAIGNAVFAATGKRLRRIPFTADRIRASLAE